MASRKAAKYVFCRPWVGNWLKCKQQTYEMEVRWFSSGSRPKRGVDIEAESPARQRARAFFAAALPASIIGAFWYAFTHPDEEPLFVGTSPRQMAKTGETVINWSATHTAKPMGYYQPENQDDVEAIVADCAAKKRRLRVVGSGLSPNAVGLSDEGMMSMALLDNILWVDPESMQVRVEAGCRVQQVADHLKPYGLSLQNYASIREQQIGGYTQVSAHGTGATIPPVDEQVVSMKIVTPKGGVLEVNAENDPELFEMARVGLGCLGVVTELTLQAVPAQKLKEKTFVATARQVARNHASWLRNNKHLRYMWLPYTDSVVVVQVNPDGPPAKPAVPRHLVTEVADKDIGSSSNSTGSSMSAYGDVVQADDVNDKELARRLQPMRDLLLQQPGVTLDQISDLSATELRDALLILDPLDKKWVAKVNQAEAEYWKRSAGTRVGYADQILGFDCGGQQWVLEVAFPIGSYKTVTNSWRSKNTDISYMKDLLQEIQSADIPAHSPIEQRWTSSSTSPMSPAAAGAGSPAGLPSDTVHSWVGIIMYLPTEDPEQRQDITERFQKYADMVQDKLMPKYNASWHWAKIEVPRDAERLAAMKGALAARFPVERFNAYRAQYDPDNILSNRLLDTLLGKPKL